MGCAASSPAPPPGVLGVSTGNTHDTATATTTASPPLQERHEFSDARQSGHGPLAKSQQEPNTTATAKYSLPNESKTASLLSLAMEADDPDHPKVPMAAVTIRSHGKPPSASAALDDEFQNDDHPHDMPDVVYSIRGHKQTHTGPMTTTTTTGGADPSSPSAGFHTTAGLSRNVVANRPSMHHLQPGNGVNAEFYDPRGGHNHGFVPLQPFMGGGGGGGGPPGVVPFLPMQPNQGQPIQIGMHMHPSPVIGGHPHAFHLAPLDPTATRPPSFRDGAGRGSGRGLPVVMVGPSPAQFPGPGVAFGGGRGHVNPMAMGRPPGQPLQITIPSSRDLQRGELNSIQATLVAAGQRPSLPGQATSTTTESSAAAKKALGDDADDDEDDDNDDLSDDDEQVEDWGVENESAEALPTNLGQEAVAAVQQRGPSKPPPVSPLAKATPTSGRPGAIAAKPLRPTLVLADADIVAVESDSNDDGDDSSDNGDGDDGDGELEDWLETSPDPKQPLQQMASNTAISSPSKPPSAGQLIKPYSSPTTKAGPPPASPSPTKPHGYPPLPSQQASLRQLNAAGGGGGNTSPTRPAGPPPTGSSPVKPQSYRSNIMTNALPMVMPLSSSSPHPTPVGSPQATGTDKGIRDTKVVKKKRAELPQANLPHPVPKFGDWLNSRTMINNYIILEPLGAGSYAEVKLCKEKVTGKLFAMKFINRDLMKKDKLGKQSKLDDIKREIAIMKKLNHPNVLRLYEVMDDPSMNKLFLVLEYMKHGDLLSHQKKKQQLHYSAVSSSSTNNNLHDRDLHCVLLQVILGLAYLHEQKIVHGDIKPQNLLVGDKDVVKIADFGISQSLYGSKQKLSDTAGTPAFMSPEMCSGQEYSGQLADIWAVGATAFMLKYGRPPFVANSAMQMFEKIQSDPLVFPGPIDPLLEDLLRGMLTKNPSKRMTLLQIMTHPWVTKEEHPSHFAIKEKTPQITVTNEEIDNAIDAKDKFAIIVNIRVQMMKRLQKARHEILTRRAPAPVHVAAAVVDGETGSRHDTSSIQKPSTTAEGTASHVQKSARLKTPHSSGPKSKGSNSNRVFVDTVAATTAAAASAGDKPQVLSNEEIHYRSQLFSRKKASGVGAANGASSAAFHTSLDHDLAGSMVAKDGRITDSGESEDDEEDVLSDDEEDELAVAQSPQLLDELLLTTLSMPPLTKCKALTAAALDDAAATTTVTPLTISMPTVPVSGLAHAAHTAHSPVDTQSFTATNPHLNISIAVSSLQGRRNTQEDRWTIVPAVESTVSTRWSKSLFAGLYDGHGGEECANILQDQLHAFLFRAPDAHFKSPDKVQQCFLNLDAFICDYLLHKGDLSGSTATALLVDHLSSTPATGHWKLLVGHVGDCRLVLSRRDGTTKDLTSDHRLTMPSERDRVLQLGGRVVNNRVNGVMAITRAFGDLEFKGLMDKHGGSSMSLIPNVVQQNPFQRDDERTPALLTAQPDVHYLSVDASQDEFLLIACDGLWDVMTSEEATEILRDRFHFHGNLQLAAKELAQEGIRRYSNDNISVIAIHFLPPTST